MLIGRFYFTLSPVGNLLGEYSNNLSNKCLTEAANRVSEVEDSSEQSKSRFIADYEIVWRESGLQCIPALLKIRSKPASVGIFTLEWHGGAGNILFYGEGMLFNDAMIGDYRKKS